MTLYKLVILFSQFPLLVETSNNNIELDEKKLTMHVVSPHPLHEAEFDVDRLLEPIWIEELECAVELIQVVSLECDL